MKGVEFVHRQAACCYVDRCLLVKCVCLKKEAVCVGHQAQDKNGRNARLCACTPWLPSLNSTAHPPAPCLPPVGSPFPDNVSPPLLFRSPPLQPPPADRRGGGRGGGVCGGIHPQEAGRGGQPGAGPRPPGGRHRHRCGSGAEGGVYVCGKTGGRASAAWECVMGRLRPARECVALPCGSLLSRVRSGTGGGLEVEDCNRSD